MFTAPEQFLITTHDSMPHSCRWITTCCEHAIKFAARNDVEARAFVSEQLQDRAIRVCFDRVTNQVIERRERGVKAAVMIQNRARAVDIKRRSKLFSDAPKIDIFAVKLAVAIPERMH